MLTNHALPRHPIATERVSVRLNKAAAPLRVSIARIDADHANAKARWTALGEPAYPNVAQLDSLHEASMVVPESQSWTYAGNTIRIECDMPPHSVAAITIDLPHGAEVPRAHRS
jgi:xylan 1,4-beta-xylosidase